MDLINDGNSLERIFQLQNIDVVKVASRLLDLGLYWGKEINKLSMRHMAPCQGDPVKLENYVISDNGVLILIDERCLMRIGDSKHSQMFLRNFFSKWKSCVEKGCERIVGSDVVEKKNFSYQLSSHIQKIYENNPYLNKKRKT